MKMRWRMSAQTFFLLLTQALKPNWNHVVIYNDGVPVLPIPGFLFLNLPVELDSKIPKGEIKLEEIPNMPTTEMKTGSA